MPIPSYKDRFEERLAPEITVISKGNYFENEYGAEETRALDITKMNAELAATTQKGEIEFMVTEPNPDFLFENFLKSQKKK